MAEPGPAAAEWTQRIFNSGYFHFAMSLLGANPIVSQGTNASHESLAPPSHGTWAHILGAYCLCSALGQVGPCRAHSGCPCRIKGTNTESCSCSDPESSYTPSLTHSLFHLANLHLKPLSHPVLGAGPRPGDVIWLGETLSPPPSRGSHRT
jgi:hypothetical protein